VSRFPLTFYALASALILPFAARGGSEKVMECFVLEESFPRMIVGHVVKEYGLDDKYDSVVLSQLRFSFLALPAMEKQYFSVDEVGGVIRTTKKVSVRFIIHSKVNKSSFIYGQ